MDYSFFIVLALVVFVGYQVLNRKTAVAKRGRYIDNFTFPRTVVRKLQEKYPHLNDAQVRDVVEGLRDYFHICNAAGRKMVSMPSQAVDEVWHEFILFTMQYQNFCKRGLGRFLHHVPAEAMKTPTAAQSGIKLAWKLACEREGIQPQTPSRLPRLFALDAALRIPNGFAYQLNCRGKNASGASCGGYCASHIGCSSDSSSGCSSSSSNSSDGDAGGCGGGGD
ncbi:MAG: hypothetical protein NVV73_21300 [Cellvibrionaceae bacterium]|nr:hypothetical protein [Cellvibrionaceae bacterium]